MFLIDLEKPSAISVHFILEDNLKLFDNVQNLTIMDGSIENLKIDKDLFFEVANAMKFPNYFGYNWDALDECLGDMSWLPSKGYILVLYGANKGWSQSPEILKTFVVSWLEACEYWRQNKVPFHLIFAI